MHLSKYLVAKLLIVFSKRKVSDRNK